MYGSIFFILWCGGLLALEADESYVTRADPERIIEYKMEVLRNPTTPSFPLFRVTPEDDKPVSIAIDCLLSICIYALIPEGRRPLHRTRKHVVIHESQPFVLISRN